MIDYGLYDADQHYYEAEDALTRYLDRTHRYLVRWVDIEGRRTLIVNDISCPSRSQVAQPRSAAPAVVPWTPHP